MQGTEERQIDTHDMEVIKRLSDKEQREEDSFFCLSFSSPSFSMKLKDTGMFLRRKNTENGGLGI